MALRILPFLSGLAVLGGFFLNPLSSAHAQQLDALSIGKWTITPYFGATVLNNQTMVEAATLSASGSITFSDGSILSATAAATLNETDFSDFYDTPLVFGADVGYMQTERLEVFGGFRYTTASGDSFTNVGSITAAFNFTDSSGTTTAVAIGDTIQASLGDYSSYSFSGGARHYLTDSRLAPFVGASVGYLRVDDISAKARLVNIAAQTGDIKYFDTSNIWTAGIQGGINFGKFGLQANLDYQPELNGDDSDIGLVGLGAINDTGGGFTVGIVARLTIAF